MGLADLVFPGATHTRFAHSLGVLHIVSEMLEAIERNYKKKYDYKQKLFGDTEKQKIRLAALLHDIGHLPLSHAMEQPIQRYQWEETSEVLAIEKKTPRKHSVTFGVLDETAKANCDQSFSHEKYGMELVDKRYDLRKILKKYNLNNEIGKIFTRAHIENYKYGQFISGTFDTDRMDFLLRDSMAAGVSYGSIDLKYLLDNINFDKETGHFYVDYSGIHALEHFIISRYFLYNVTYHKTVMGLELLAKHAYYCMLKDDALAVPASMRDLLRIARDDIEFFQFNDFAFWSFLINWKPSLSIDKMARNSLLYRNPPVELFEERLLPEHANDHSSDHSFQILDENLVSRQDFLRLLDKFKIERRSIFLLENKIKFEQIAPLTPHSEEADPSKEWTLCQVFYNGEVRKLIDVKPSIVARLSQYYLHLKRMYYLPLDGKRPDRARVRKAILGLLR